MGDKVEVEYSITLGVCVGYSITFLEHAKKEIETWREVIGTRPLRRDLQDRRMPARFAEPHQKWYSYAERSTIYEREDELYFRATLWKRVTHNMKFF